MKNVGCVALGLDPCLARFGWALVRVEPSREHVLDAGVIRTRVGYGVGADEPSSVDLHRRGRELASELRLVLQRERIAVICTPTLPLTKSARAMQEYGRAWGIVDTCATALDLPLLEVSLPDLGEAVAKSREAQSADIERALRQRYPGEWLKRVEDDVPPKKRSHAFAAVGAVVASLSSPTLRAARQMRGAA